MLFAARTLHLSTPQRSRNSSGHAKRAANTVLVTMQRQGAPVLAATIALLLCTSAIADCPDKDVRCRIPNAESLTQESNSGCEAGMSVNAGIEGELPVASATIDGKCYDAYKESDGTTFIPMGSLSSGTCWQWSSFSCQPCRSLVEMCGDEVGGCKSCGSKCTKEYTVVSGGDCSQIASDNGMTLDALQGMNPGVECEPLQINQKICLEMGQGDCTNRCEGRIV